MSQKKVMSSSWIQIIVARTVILKIELLLPSVKKMIVLYSPPENKLGNGIGL